MNFARDDTSQKYLGRGMMEPRTCDGAATETGVREESILLLSLGITLLCFSAATVLVL